MDKLTDSLRKTIQKVSGIIITEDLQPAILEYVNGKQEELHLSTEAYCALVNDKPKEMERLINATTVNETYFFREEMHYDFLCNEFFPSKGYSSIHIWCGACSTGEEPLSIHALAKSLCKNVEITATDINTDVLDTFKKGTYSKKSFRKDGEKYHHLIKEISTCKEDLMIINPEALKSIHISSLNLNRNTPLPFVMNCFDLIVLRNVFIYFSEEVTLKILGYLWPILKEDGILLLSANEVASIPENQWFEKECKGSVYYLQKKNILPKKKPTSKAKLIDFNNEFKTAVSKLEEELLSGLKFTGKAASVENYREIIDYINRENYKKAESLLNSMDFSASELEYKYFFAGLIQYQRSEFQEAEINLFKSANLNLNFWPATMMLAFTYKHIGKFENSYSWFEQSLNMLTEYVKTGKTCYNFTIDFDPVYIITICRKNMDEIRKNIGE